MEAPVSRVLDARFELVEIVSELVSFRGDVTLYLICSRAHWTFSLMVSTVRGGTGFTRFMRARPPAIIAAATIPTTTPTIKAASHAGSASVSAYTAANSRNPRP